MVAESKTRDGEGGGRSRLSRPKGVETQDQFVTTFDCHSPFILALVPPSKTQDSMGRTVADAVNAAFRRSGS